jgi:protein-L-isoaspartate(D-aspartate) O-methyltransferase
VVESPQDDFAAQRAAMVEQQLRARGIRDERVLAAMGRVPREIFVPEGIAHEAYQDCALPIECGQTISQPIIVGLMSEALEFRGDERVLEVGTGSGYQAAVLAELAGEAYSIERHAGLAKLAETRLTRLGYENVKLRTGDGSLGWPEAAPFDRIIITSAAKGCPPALWEQLADGGILVGPFGPPSEQSLLAIRKRAGRADERVLTACRFVPLITGPTDAKDS